MSKPKPIHSAIHLLYGAQPQPIESSGLIDLERFPGGGGWAVTVSRGPRRRAAFPSNLAKRDAAVADLKVAAKRNKAFIWGTYESQKSTLDFAHDDPGCPNKGSPTPA